MILLTAAIRLFIAEQISRGNTIRTVRYYESCLGYFLDYCSDIDISVISTSDLKEYVIHLLSSGIKKVTVKSYTRALKVFFRWLYEMDYIKNDITKRFRLVKVPAEVVQPLTDEELRIIINHYDNSPIGIRNRCILLMMCDCGLRLSEVTSLKLKDVNLPTRTVFVTGKGGKSRLVPLGTVAAELIGRYLKLRSASSSAPELFVTSGGKRLTNSAIDSLFARLRKSCGIERLHPHLLRHTFATNFIYDGGDVSALRVILGHSDIKTTQIYLHLAENKRLFLELSNSHFDNLTGISED